MHFQRKDHVSVSDGDTTLYGGSSDEEEMEKESGSKEVEVKASRQPRRGAGRPIRGGLQEGRTQDAAPVGRAGMLDGQAS